jgi:hypothetical protein
MKKENLQKMSIKGLLEMLKTCEELYEIHWCWKRKAKIRRDMDLIKTVIINKDPSFL